VRSEFYGNIVDVFKTEIYPGKISVENGRIKKIERCFSKSKDFILPGFIDSHIHIESSMLTPQHFSRIAVSHGTVATVSDPHEIANVLGLDGVRYMIRNSAKAELKFFFGAPSCVPATTFESSGESIDLEDIEILFRDENLLFLSEVMNFPGVIHKDKNIVDKISIAKRYNKLIDGHAPGLTGKDLDKYIEAGIGTDHECFTYSEAVEKIRKGMKIQIRQGSAAKNFNALEKLIDEYPETILLCTDDLHPNDLVKGHINNILAYGIKQKLNLFKLLRSVTINPVKHYNLDVGLLRENDPADFVIVEDLVNFQILKTIIDGKLVFEKGKKLKFVPVQEIANNFNAVKIAPKILKVPDKGKRVLVIEAQNGELITRKNNASLPVRNGFLQTDIVQDVLKIVVLNRYKTQPPAVAFIKNFGFKSGAIASSITHDSHNIIAIGVNDNDICECINWIIDRKGGIAVHDGKSIIGMPLPVAGIMSDQPAEWVAKKYKRLSMKAINLGCKLESPFMTLSFMGLLVIPKLKLSDKGLFDVEKFEFTSLYI
jgi:adenine deaminase